MTDAQALAFYSAPSPMTDLRRCPPEALAGLPAAPADLMEIVRGCVIDPATLTHVYKLPIPNGRDDERQIRTAHDMITHIRLLDPRRVRRRDARRTRNRRWR